MAEIEFLVRVTAECPRTDEHQAEHERLFEFEDQFDDHCDRCMNPIAPNEGVRMYAQGSGGAQYPDLYCTWECAAIEAVATCAEGFYDGEVHPNLVFLEPAID